MSALEKQHILEAPAAKTSTQVGGDANDSVDNSMFHGSAGPAALAQLMIYQMMALYLEIIGLDQQQKATETQAQASQAKAQADATIAAGNALGQSMIVGAAIGIAGAIAGFASNFLVKIGDYNTNKTAMEEIEGQMSPLKQIEKSDDEILDPNTTYGPKKHDDAITPAVQTRIEELRSGNYAGSKEMKDPAWQEDTDTAIQQLKGMRNKDGVQTDDYAKFKEAYQDRMARHSRDLNTRAQKMLEISNFRQTVSQMINGLSTSAGQVSQGVGNINKAQYDANAILNQTASSMAGSQTQEFAGAMSKAFDAAIQALRTLQEIHRTNSVQG